MNFGQSQATLRRPQRRDPTNGEHDPAKLSASLRELAVRAHHLIRRGPGSGRGQNLEPTEQLSFEAQQELAEVHAQIVQLQRRLRAQNLHQLVTYVSALRQQVEERLA